MKSAFVRFVERRVSAKNYRRLRLILTAWRMLRDPSLSEAKTCNICGYHGPMAPFGSPLGGTELQCPNCHSLERHRLLHCWVKNNRAAIKHRDVLHFAPEPAVRMFIAPLARTYVTADLRPGVADIIINIEAIELPDGCVDVAICSHVLEHVEDDRTALSELHRILRPGGMALLMFPVIHSWSTTYEDTTIRSPKGRHIHFGQGDHVRLYGADVTERIAAAGFQVATFVATEPDVHRLGLARGETLYIATLP
jgi:SAM-dependent methyltransferase